MPVISSCTSVIFNTNIYFNLLLYRYQRRTGQMTVGLPSDDIDEDIIPLINKTYRTYNRPINLKGTCALFY